MEPKKLLLESGLDQKESNIYLALLDLNEATVLEISKKANVKRPSTYVNLEDLERKGFVTRVLKNKKTLYRAVDPRKLLTKAESHVKNLTDVMPQLEALFNKEEGKPRVTFFEGREQMEHAFDEMFVVRGDICYIGTLSLSTETFPKTYEKAGQVKYGPDFVLREIIDDTKESRAYAKQVCGPYREVRFLPKELQPFEADVAFFGNRVLITSVKKEYFTISIESEEISRAFRGMYNVIWSLAKQ